MVRFKIQALGEENYKEYKTIHLSYSIDKTKTYVLKVKTNVRAKKVVIYHNKSATGSLAFEVEFGAGKIKKDITEQKTIIAIPANYTATLKLHLKEFTGSLGIFIADNNKIVNN